MATRIYLDANAVIGAVERDNDDVAGRVAEIVTIKTAVCVSSELTLAEVLVGVLRPTGDGGAADHWLAAAYERFLREDGPIEVVPLKRLVLVEAAKLRAARLSLKMPDAIHLSTALTSNCTVMLSNDRDLGKAAQEHGLSVSSLKVTDLDALLARIAPAS